MAANGGTALRNLDKFRNRVKKINTVTPQPNYTMANLPKSQNEMVSFLEKLAQEMAVQRDTDSRVQALRKLCDLVYLLVQVRQQNHSSRQRASINKEDNSEDGVDGDNIDGEQLWSAFLSNAKILRNALNFAVTDDKLAVVAREACETLVTLATLIKDELAEPLAEYLVSSLWKASNSNVSGVSEVAVKTLRTFIQYVQHRKLVKAVLNLFTTQPMTLPMSRNLASEFVGNILIYQKPTDFQPHLEELEKVIAIGLKDSSSTIKATYRKNFWLLAKAMPEQVQEWVLKMDTIDWSPVQEARPAEAPSLVFCNTSKSSERSHAGANVTGPKKAATKKTSPLKNVSDHEGNNGRKGKTERSQPPSSTMPRTSMRTTSSSAVDTRNAKLGEKKSNNAKTTRTMHHTVSSSAKRISSDKRKDSESATQKPSIRRSQEKQHKEENLEGGDTSQPAMEEKVSDVKEVIVETQEEEKNESPLALFTEENITEKVLTEVLDKFHTLTDMNIKVQIIQTIENHLDNAMKEVEKQQTNSTSTENDSHWIKKEEKGPVNILHFVPLVLEIITKYLLDGNEKLVVPAMKAFIKILEACKGLGQHNRTLHDVYRAVEENFRENSVLLQKIFEKSGDSNGFIASTAATVLEEMELAMPFFPFLLECISHSCLRHANNQELPVKVILQALIHIKMAIQKNRKEKNSYFGETAGDNPEAISMIELLVKDVGPHAAGKSAELRRAACDVFMELQDVPAAVLEQVVVERDESKHLHLVQRLGLVASSVSDTQEKPDSGTLNIENSVSKNTNSNNVREAQEDEPPVEKSEAKSALHNMQEESRETDLDATKLTKTSSEASSNAENGKHSTLPTKSSSKIVTPTVPLEDTFQSEFEALKEKWMRNKEQNENEGKEDESMESKSVDQKGNAMEQVEMEDTHQVSDTVVAHGEASDTQLEMERSTLPEKQQQLPPPIEEQETRNNLGDQSESTSCIGESTESCNVAPKADTISLPNLRSDATFIKNIAQKLCTVNKEDERECSATLTEIREQLQLEENTFGVAEIYDLLFMFLSLSREASPSATTNHLLDMEFLWQMNFRELWKRSSPADCLEALDLFCWVVDETCNLSRIESYLQAPSKTFEMKMLFQGIEHALKILDQPIESMTTTQQEQIERLKPAISNALQHKTCLEIKQAAHKCIEETKDRLRNKQETIPFLEWCKDLEMTVA